ncbi:MinD/ParA family ATP-binding protein [Pseudoclavibacter terrae]|uniref:MinD/ParA family ATP-binding protein n=1 Tax=Pseudoclavibacter terrae TaxID=1530195 RepID=UPI00232C2BC8|nr:P-loop NTPase [Pseudoclavibacter terrae]
MSRILLAIEFEIEARLLEGIIAAGHDIVDRVSGGLAAATALERLRPEIVVLQGAPETLTPRSLAACARFGARAIVVVSSDLERRNAETLAVTEVVEAAVSWSEIEVLLARTSTESSHTMPTGPIPQRPVAFSRPPDVSSHPSEEDRSDPAEPGRPTGGGAGRGGRGARRRAASTPGRAGDHLVGHERGSSAVPLRLARADGRGTVLAVWGPHGAPGASTVAAAVASKAAEMGQRVLLVDADSYGGSLAAMLGITDEAPGFAAACRLAGAARLTVAEVERIAVPRSFGRGGLLVLTGIANPARWPELARDRVATVLEKCREVADLVVVDVGFSLESDDEIASDAFSPRRSAATLTTLTAADRVLAVADGQAVGLQRFLRARANLVDLVGDTPTDIIVNRVRADAVGLGAAGQIRHVLSRFAGLEAQALIPLDQSACDRALLAGEPVSYASPRSAFARAIGTYVSDTLLASAGSGLETRQPKGENRRRTSAFRRFWRGRGELQAQNS